MAAVVSIPTSRKSTIGTWKVGIADVTMDSSYPTGGEALDPADFGITTPYIVLVGTASGFVAEWDYTNKKLIVYNQGITTGSTATGALANGAFIEDVDAAETVVRASNTAIDTTYSFGAMKEVPATTDLSTVKFRVVMIGE